MKMMLPDVIGDENQSQ